MTDEACVDCGARPATYCNADGHHYCYMHYPPGWRTEAAPTGVRVVTYDGTVLPVELVYDGQDGDGIHHWTAVVTAPTLKPGATLKADTLPARTSIHVAFEPRP